jgi:hypothetical protein
MNLLYYTIIPLLFLSSCHESENETALVIITHKEATVESQSKPYSNPNLIYGSSFGNYFQALYRQDRFGDLLKFSDSQSRKRFGDGRLIGFYKNDFHFDFQMNKLTATNKSGDTTLLIYSEAIILGTKRKIIIPCLIQNDSCKIVIRNLKPSFQYLQ